MNAITAFAAAIIAVLFGLLALENIISGTSRDPNAPPPTTPVAAVIFVSFFVLFGLITLGQGIWQIVFGARNRVLMITMIVMGALLVAAGILARALK